MSRDLSDHYIRILARNGPGILLEFLHKRMMDGANVFIMQGMDSLIDWLCWEEGSLTPEQAEVWKRRIRKCPEGRDDHVGLRHWCAYCGDVTWEMCEGCGQIYTLWEDEDKVLAIRDCELRHRDKLCQACWRKDYPEDWR